MTYCVGILTRTGLVMASDSRTNAGVDHISTFRKMTVWEKPGDRVVVLLAAGNLAVTQAVVTLLHEGVGDNGEAEAETLMNAPSLFRCAQLVGRAIRQVYAADGEAMKEQGAEFNATFILGGQRRGRPPRLFQIYAAGNFIEASQDTNYFQIGETKYGKPILDRLVSFDVTLADATKLALISIDSTLRSNISVGMPVDLLVYERDSHSITRRVSLHEDHAYFSELRRRWSQGLSEAFSHVPDMPWTPER